MSCLIATVIGLNLSVFEVEPPDMEINFRCQKPGFYLFFLGYPGGTQLGVKLLDPLYEEHKCFYLTSLPFGLPEVESALGVKDPFIRVGLFGVDEPGYYTVNLQASKTTRVTFLESANSYPDIYELGKGQSLKMRTNLTADERVLLCILSENKNQKAVLKVIGPGGAVVNETKITAPLALVPILPTKSGEYHLILRSETEGSYIVIKESLTIEQ